ncbi:MAG: hypothetical protein AVDCRST_MAG49-2433 [uncultured Thermomicrobiales bacterium]|uniref:Uncharacterized protein n=1 Tax=uncultured Thermomicrobiales bacterium TaxID=1645740 RepID=A0A6J4V097_9BACT|nr:MAG: hypothetical protein AVDCRST_MAG49-2433 [uncultured Thermomicrobiales bacterium]
MSVPLPQRFLDGRSGRAASGRRPHDPNDCGPGEAGLRVLASRTRTDSRSISSGAMPTRCAPTWVGLPLGTRTSPSPRPGCPSVRLIEHDHAVVRLGLGQQRPSGAHAR